MSILLQMSPTTASTLKEVLDKQLTEKRSTIKVLETECKEIEKLIYQIETSDNFEKPAEAVAKESEVALALGYKSSMTWEQKIKFIMSYRGNLGLTTSQIVETLLEFEPQLQSDRAKVVASLSAILSAKIKENKLFYRKLNERNENVYFLVNF